MKLFRPLLFSFFFLLVFNFAFCQDKENRKLLVGTWKFFGLAFPDKQVSDQKHDALQSLETNKELTISFDTYGHFKIHKLTAGKKDDRLVAGKLALTQNGKHLSIEGLAGDIVLLNNEYLKLSQPDKSVMIFHRTDFVPD